MKRTPGRPKKEKTEVLWLRVPTRIAQKVRDEAYRAGREVSGHVRIILENHYAPKADEKL